MDQSSPPNILSGFKRQISGLKLVPDTGGCFEVKFGNELVYSKLSTGQFPDEAAIIDMVTSKLKK